MTAMYRRSSRAVSLPQVPAALLDALHAHAASRQLIVNDAAPAWLHHSENLPASSAVGRMLRRRANPTDPDVEHEVLVVLHPTHVLVVIAGAKRGVSAMSLALSQASVASGTALGGNDSGFTLTGFAGEPGRPGSFFVGVGPEPAGGECTEAVRAAVSAAR